MVFIYPFISTDSLGLKRVKTIDCHDQDEHFTTFEEASYSLWAQSLQPSSFFAPDYNSHIYRFSYSRFDDSIASIIDDCQLCYPYHPRRI